MMGLSIVSLLIVGAIGLGALLLALGLIGRRCRRCGADVRAAVWSEPLRCACGASLERFGSVRTGRWGRSWRTVIVGIALLGLGVGAMRAAMRNELDSEWVPGWAPWWLVDWRLGAGDSWAVAETARRLEADALSTVQATSLALAIDFRRRAGLSATTPSETDPIERLALRRADATDERLHDAAANAIAAAVTGGTVMPEADDDAQLILIPLPGAGPPMDEAFLILDEVRVNGTPARWRRLDVGRAVGALVEEAALKELLVRGVRIAVELPALEVGLPAGTHTLALEGIYGRMIVGEPLLVAAFARDPARRSLPASWGLPAFGARRTVEISFTVGLPEEAEEVPDDR
jgi:hypothetical protein